jgi:hypothetical protein
MNASRKWTDFVSEEAAGDVDFLAANYDDFLAREDLLGDDGGQPTKEMTLAIDNDGRRGKRGHGCLAGAFRMKEGGGM